VSYLAILVRANPGDPYMWHFFLRGYRKSTSHWGSKSIRGEVFHIRPEFWAVASNWDAEPHHITEYFFGHIIRSEADFLCSWSDPSCFPIELRPGVFDLNLPEPRSQRPSSSSPPLPSPKGNPQLREFLAVLLDERT